MAIQFCRIGFISKCIVYLHFAAFSVSELASVVTNIKPALLFSLVYML